MIRSFTGESVVDLSHPGFMHILQTAISAAEQSPCRSKRGAIIYEPDFRIVSWGFNAPPRGFSCDASDICKQNCSKTAVLAEANALQSAAAQQRSVVGTAMLHVKVANAEIAETGGPSCWQCSKAILAAGISFMTLMQPDGHCTWAAEDFHRITLRTCVLPIIGEAIQ